MNRYDVVIHMDEPRYWVMLGLSFLVGLALVRRFNGLKGEAKDRGLVQMGAVLLTLQVGYQIYMVLDPHFEYSIHRSLPLHFCGINIWLLGLNCFWRNRWVFLFTAFMGTIGGFHAILTPQLTVGDAFPILVHYYINHAALVFVPIVMAQAYGMRFPEWGWVKVYLMAAGASTVMAGINHSINVCFPSDVVANYMYMTEPPKVDNPFVFHDWAWPWYVVPLHVALVLHLLLLNALYRWRLPSGRGGEAWSDGQTGGRLPFWK